MLSKKQREHLKNYHELYNLADNSKNPVSEHENLRQMNNRIRKKALDAIMDLTLIAETMPEKQKEQIFTKDNIRDFIKAMLNDGDGKRFGFTITEDEIKMNLPEPIYNKRIFDMGVLLADFGISSAYSVISWKQRVRDINRQLSKGEMWEIIGVLDNYGYILTDKK